MHLALSRIHFPVTTLGPGKRLGIWFQGCSLRCPGCVSVDTWHARAPTLSVSDVMHAVKDVLAQCDGVTISGGEPFEQPEGLEVLLRALREVTSTNVLVYSGFPYEEIATHPAVKERLIDALMTDPYEHQAPQTKPLRGSDNQRLHYISELGARLFSDYETPMKEFDKHLDVMFDDDGSIWFAGIPRRGDLMQLKRLMCDAGHTVQTTEANIKGCTPK